MRHTGKYLTPEQLEAVRKNTPIFTGTNQVTYRQEHRRFTLYLQSLAYRCGLPDAGGRYGIDLVSGEFLQEEMNR